MEVSSSLARKQTRGLRSYHGPKEGVMIERIWADVTDLANSHKIAGYILGDDDSVASVSDGDLHVLDQTVVDALADVTKEEDAAHVSGEKGLFTLAVRNDTPSA